MLVVIHFFLALYFAWPAHTDAMRKALTTDAHDLDYDYDDEDDDDDGDDDDVVDGNLCTPRRNVKKEEKEKPFCRMPEFNVSVMCNPM